MVTVLSVFTLVFALAAMALFAAFRSVRADKRAALAELDIASNLVEMKEKTIDEMQKTINALRSEVARNKELALLLKKAQRENEELKAMVEKLEEKLKELEENKPVAPVKRVARKRVSTTKKEEK